MPTSPTVIYTNKRVIPANPNVPAPTIPIKLLASKTYLAGQILGELIGNNEVQTVTITGTPTGGTFTLTYAGQTTGAIAYNATAATVQAALEALSNVGTGNVAVTGGPGPGTPYVVTFQGALGHTNVAIMTATGSLTGGASPAVGIAETTAGSAGTPGTFDAFNSAATNGLQYWTAILMWDTQTDSDGKVIGELNRTFEKASAYCGGQFQTSDLVGLTPAAIASRPGAHLVQGTIANKGYVQF